MKKSILLKLATLVAISILSATLGSAANANPWADFHLHNDSNHTIISFQTNEGNGWSKNWFKSNFKVKPGGVADMQFGNQDGPCKVKFRVIAEDKFTYDYVGDFCKVTNLYIDDSTVHWD